MKKFISLALASIIIAALNFLLFIFTYNKLATPYLHETQRMENADFIISIALLCFGFIALTSTLAIYILSKKINQ